jgi:hypothetical protein
VVAALIHADRHDDVNSRFLLLMRTRLDMFTRNNILARSDMTAHSTKHSLPYCASICATLCCPTQLYPALPCPALILRCQCRASPSFTCVARVVTVRRRWRRSRDKGRRSCVCGLTYETRHIRAQHTVAWRWVVSPCVTVFRGNNFYSGPTGGAARFARSLPLVNIWQC